MYDMNDTELPRSSDLIPDGTFAKVTTRVRKARRGRGAALAQAGPRPASHSSAGQYLSGRTFPEPRRSGLICEKRSRRTRKTPGQTSLRAHVT
jgi:hypothetical protein